MTDPAFLRETEEPARPPDHDSAAALPLGTRDGTASVALPATPASALAREPLPRLIARFALPAVGSNLVDHLAHGSTRHRDDRALAEWTVEAEGLLVAGPPRVHRLVGCAR